MNAATFFATHPVFTHGMFAALTGAGTARSPRTVDSLLLHHVAGGHIVRIRRGLYATVPLGQDPATFQPDPFVIASHLAPGAVIGYHAALQLHGKAYSVWNRYPVLVSGVVSPFAFRGSAFVPVRLPPAARVRSDQGGGIAQLPYAGTVVRVTTLERTLVDLMNVPALGGGWEEIWRSLNAVEYFDLDAVVAYALLLGSALTAARVGYYLEHNRERLFVDERYLAPLAAAAPAQPRYWDESRAKGQLCKPWNLIVPGWLQSGRVEGEGMEVADVDA